MSFCERNLFLLSTFTYFVNGIFAINEQNRTSTFFDSTNRKRVWQSHESIYFVFTEKTINNIKNCYVLSDCYKCWNDGIYF
jgi:hypothetical protein